MAIVVPAGTSDRGAPNKSFKPTPLRYGKKLAKKACQLFPSTARRGLILVLGDNREMIRFSILLAIAVTSACAQTDAQSTGDCVVLLKQIKHLPFRAEWPSCNTSTGPESDRAHCKLLDPSERGTDSCLVAKITDLSMIPDPRSPRMMDQIALGDLAFFVLNDRHPFLWDTALPAATDGTPGGYFKIVNAPGERERLQVKVRGLVP